MILDTNNVYALETNEPGTPKGLVYDRKRDLVLFSLVEEDKVYASKVDMEGTQVFLELGKFYIYAVGSLQTMCTYCMCQSPAAIM